MPLLFRCVNPAIALLLLVALLALLALLATPATLADAVQAPSSALQLPADAATYRQDVVDIFTTAYGANKRHAFGQDEVQPIAHQAVNSLNGWGATIVDSMSTMVRRGVGLRCLPPLTGPGPPPASTSWALTTSSRRRSILHCRSIIRSQNRTRPSGASAPGSASGRLWR
jgi:hypothetical protein